MYQYPKQILTIEQQVQSYVDAGMEITSCEDVEKALKSIGFYRLRVRLVEALLIHGEPLILQDSSIFKEKKRYWQNMSTVASEIARSNDVFIKHNFDNLAMKYLRLSDEEWIVFVDAFDKMIQNNSDVVILIAMNLPTD